MAWARTLGARAQNGSARVGAESAPICAYGEAVSGSFAIVEPVSDLNLILIGPPGAGKGTQAARLREDFDLSHIATGDLLRAHRERETDLGLRAARYMAEGRLVPDELVTEMIGDAIASTSGGFLLDGFPRTPGQADALDRVLEERGRPLSAVLLIDVPDDVLVERIGGRRLCPDGHVYHVQYNPPAREGVCDVDGKPLTQREDDKPETVRKRLDVYHRETEPLVERYEKQGLLRRVDGTRSPDEVHDAAARRAGGGAQGRALERELLVGHRLERQPVQRRDAEALDRGAVLGRRVADVGRELPARIARLHAVHEAVARDLRDHGGGGDRGARRVAADDRALLEPRSRAPGSRPTGTGSPSTPTRRSTSRSAARFVLCRPRSSIPRTQREVIATALAARSTRGYSASRASAVCCLESLSAASERSSPSVSFS